MKPWQTFRYKNITLLFISFLVATFISRYEPFHNFLLDLGDLGYLGALVAGVLFVSTFTVATGIIILLVLAENLSAIEIGLIAGLGALLGDFIIFRFIKNNLSNEIKDIYEKIDGNHHLQKVFNSRYFSWSLPVVGALIIATPFPDEIGISLMGISKLKTYQFLLLSFLLNAIGIFFVITASIFIKP